MINKLRDLWPVRRGMSLARGFWETFLRDNKIIPPVLAVVALFVFAWIVVGSFIGAPDDEPVSNQGEIAQSDEAAPPAPEIENPNSDSYAAYQSKDPFRQLFESAEATTQQTGDTDENTTPDETTAPDDSSSGSDDDFDSSDNTSDDLDSSDEDPDDGRDSGDRPPRADPTDNGDAGSPAEDQYRETTRGENTPRRDDSTGRTPRRDSGDGLFDSGGDLEYPDQRLGGALR